MNYFTLQEDKITGAKNEPHGAYPWAGPDKRAFRRPLFRSGCPDHDGHYFF
jgi:hypothetical protein